MWSGNGVNYQDQQQWENEKSEKIIESENGKQFLKCLMRGEKSLSHHHWGIVTLKK